MEVYCKECEFYKAPSWADDDFCIGSCNHPKNLKEKWSWFEKIFVSIKSPKKLNKNRQCEWHKYKKSVYKEGAYDYYNHQLELHKSILKDLCDEEDDCQEMALKVLTKGEVYGDSYCAHGMREVVELLVRKIKDLQCDHDWQLMTPDSEYCHKCGGRR
jgi:hypothetical protein